MQMDETTQADLELFGTGSGGDGIFGLIDRTTTRAGWSALRGRLERPLTAIEDIRAVQDALAALAGLPRPIPLDDRVMVDALQYLRSNVVPSRRTAWGAAAEEAWVRIRYPVLTRELTEGVASVRALAELGRRAVRFLARLEVPLLQELRTEISACVTALDEAVGHSLLVTDRLLRELHAERIRRAVALLGEVDALQSMATMGRDAEWVRPELVEGDEFLLEAQGAVHPFLPDGTPNPIDLGGGEPLVFLTGPNMGGKTTYMRTVALLVVLAQTGMSVPAEHLRLTPIDAILTSLNPSDNLRAGISYFYAEILRVKEAAHLLAARRRCLILFDEVFKGTNVRDALEASAEVIRGFARTRRSGSIFSSHLTELAEVLRENPAVRFCRFEGEVFDGRPSFDYRLSQGVSDQRFGMLLLRDARVPELMARIGP